MTDEAATCLHAPRRRPPLAAIRRHARARAVPVPHESSRDASCGLLLLFGFNRKKAPSHPGGVLGIRPTFANANLKPDSRHEVTYIVECELIRIKPNTNPRGPLVVRRPHRHVRLARRPPGHVFLLRRC